MLSHFLNYKIQHLFVYKLTPAYNLNMLKGIRVFAHPYFLPAVDLEVLD